MGIQKIWCRYNFDRIKKKSMEKKFKKLSKAKYNGFGVQGKNSLVKAFLKYAGNKNLDTIRKSQIKHQNFSVSMD